MEQKKKIMMMMKKKLKMGFKIGSNRSRLVFVILLAFFILMNFWMLNRIQDSSGHHHLVKGLLKSKLFKSNTASVNLPEELRKIAKGKKPHKTAYARLLHKAAHALAENQYKSTEPKDLWMEPYHAVASTWQPCADQRVWKPSEGNNGYIMVTANGGINQQRVAVCNIVAVARLLNATLVIPNFMFSSVWRDTSQFADIYQEDYFIDYLKPDIHITCRDSGADVIFMHCNLLQKYKQPLLYSFRECVRMQHIREYWMETWLDRLLSQREKSKKIFDTWLCT